MSVIRRPGLFARNTRHRLAGITAAASAAAIETLTVGLWFTIVAIDPGTAAAALLGLCILFCGSLLRASVFEVTTASLGAPFQPDRVAVALALVGGWVCWLFVAETIGGGTGVGIAALTLALLLTGQLALESRVFGPVGGRIRSLRAHLFAGAVPACLVATGATVLLASVWFTDWAVTTAPLSLGSTTVVVRLEAFQLGYLAFALFAFLAQQRRFRLLLAP